MAKANHIILITGANRGLGLAITERLLEMGHHIIAVVRRTSGELRALQEKYTDRLKRYNADVTDEPSIRHAMTQINRDIGHIDILVNNSAVHLDPERLPIEQVEDFSVYARTYQVNAVGPLIVTKHALPLIRKGQAKLIVNVSSEAGSIGNAWRKGEYAYCMSKAALNMASQILQNDVREQGIKVMALHPGWFSSDMGGQEAPITPTNAAVDVVDMILKSYDLDGPVYYGPDGKVMAW